MGGNKPAVYAGWNLGRSILEWLWQHGGQLYNTMIGKRMSTVQQYGDWDLSCTLGITCGQKMEHTSLAKAWKLWFEAGLEAVFLQGVQPPTAIMEVLGSWTSLYVLCDPCHRCPFHYWLIRSLIHAHCDSQRVSWGRTNLTTPRCFSFKDHRWQEPWPSFGPELWPYMYKQGIDHVYGLFPKTWWLKEPEDSCATLRGLNTVIFCIEFSAFLVAALTPKHLNRYIMSSATSPLSRVSRNFKGWAFAPYQQQAANHCSLDRAAIDPNHLQRS